MLTAKERLRQKLKQRKQSPISSQIKIVAAESGEEKVLSFAQERLWFLSRLMGNAPVYNIPLGIRLAGCLDTEALRLSLQSIIHRHQALRTRFSERDGRVVQTIKQPEELPLEIETVYDNGKLKNIIQQERRYCFDLEQDSLYRIRLLHDCSGINSAKMPGENYVLLLTFHHIIADGWSLGVFFRELVELYHCGREKVSSTLPLLSIQYADFALWQRRWFCGDVLNQQLDYWRRQLQELPPLLELPTDRPRPKEQSYRGANAETLLSVVLASQLRELNHQYHVTMFMSLLSAFAVLLSRYCGRQDIAIGTPIANRNKKETENLIGFFANTLVMRTDLSGDPCFGQLLQRVRTVALAAYAHQDIPFESVVEALNPERNLSYSPLFQVMFVLQNTPMGKVSFGDVELSPLVVEYEPGEGVSRFDMTFTLTETAQGILAEMEYSSDLFDHNTIERMLRHYQQLLDALIAEPQTPVSQLEFLGAQERKQLLSDWNATAQPVPAKWTHELFEAQADLHGPSCALIDQQNQMSYAALEGRANQVAHSLHERGVRQGEAVGVCLEPCPDMVASLLGIFKAGAVYVPLDPNYPHERLVFMLENGAIDWVLSHEAVAETLNIQALLAGRGCLWFDRGRDHRGVALSTRRDRPAYLGQVRGESPAYVIYTSGSTGQPKGVLGTHRSLVNRLQWMNAEYPGTTADRYGQKTALGFVDHLAEVLQPLSQGRDLVILPRLCVLDGRRLIDALEAYRITRLTLVPSLLSMLLEARRAGELNHLSHVISSGEALPEALMRRCLRELPQARLLNLYGSTEVGADVSYYECRHESLSRGSLIGRGLWNSELYVLDEQRRLQPIGVAGELYVGGAGLALGYQGQAALSQEKFIAHPFGGEGRLYRTGDRVRRLGDGHLQYLGRLDSQIKIRGFRIEVGEIEVRLQQHRYVEQCAVAACPDQRGEDRLVAYVVCKGVADDGEEPSRMWRTHLQAYLPEYMIPSLFVTLEALPLTPSGKLDRRGLPSVDFTVIDTDHYVAPEGETQQLVARLWAELLGLAEERISATANFFALGGHSLLLTQLLARLRAEGWSSDVRRVFSAGTLAEFAAGLTPESSVFTAPANRIPPECDCITPEMLPLVELSAAQLQRIGAVVPGGMRMIQDIYPLAPLQEGIWFHHQLDASHDPYVLQLPLLLESETQCEELLSALQRVIDRHDVLRTAVLSQGLSQPLQVVYRQARLKVDELVLSGEGDVQAQLQACLSAPERFDLSQPPLLRARVGPVGGDSERWGAVLLLHHLVVDRVAMEALVGEIQACMRAEALPPVVQYREFVAWALHSAGGDSGSVRGKNTESKSAAYFRARLGEIDEPTLLFNRSDTRGDGSELCQRRRQMSASLGGGLRRVARAHRVSPAILVHAAWAVVVGRCSGRERVVFGTVLSGRIQGGASGASMLGLFINTLPLRVDLAGRSVGQLVRETERGLSELLRYEQSPLPLAQSCSGVRAGQALFNSMLNYRQLTLERGALPLDGDEGAFLVERSNYPFNLSVTDYGEGFSLDAQVHRTVDVDHFLNYFETSLEQLLAALTEAGDVQVDTLSVVPDSEEKLLLHCWNNTTENFPQEKSIHALFEQQVRCNGGEIALIFKHQQLTYHMLNRRANQLAHFLRSRGVRENALVALHLERSVEMLIGVLGTLKAGGAYVPIDPSYPAERTSFMLADCAATLVLSQSHLQQHLPDKHGALPVIFLDSDSSNTGETGLLSGQPETNVDAAFFQAQQLAYVVYTSGSTGKPKGVMVHHSAVVNFLKAMAAILDIRTGENVFALTTLSFDIAGLELYLPLLNGARVVLTPSAQVNPQALAESLEEHGIDMMQATPATWHMLLESGWQGKKDLKALCGGEALSHDLAQALVPKVKRLWNLYGPTETTIWSTYQPVGVEQLSDANRNVAIGKPISNTRVYVLDQHLRPALLGTEGELYIAGSGVARGYLNQPELTAQRFVADPFTTQPGTLMYRTGDQVCWSREGKLHYKGRLDDQVKVRGFRIETGEIESALAAREEVRQCVVVVRKDLVGNARLVAYLVKHEELVKQEDSVKDENLVSSNNTESLRKYLQNLLPDYMVPSAYVVLAQLPMTPNGKVDRNALPAPEGKAFAQEDYIAPRTPIELALAKIWAELLGLRPEVVSLTADFFTLGGHSLLATTLANRIKQDLSTDIPIRSIFEHPRLAQIAQQVNEAQRKALQFPVIKSAGASAEVSPFSQLSYAQQRLWFLARLEGNSAHYNIPLAINLTGNLNDRALITALHRLVNRHQVLRTYFLEKDGIPYQGVRQSDQFIISKENLANDVDRQAICAAEALAPFNLNGGSLCRIRLLKINAIEHLLLVTMHHCISDAWSMGIFFRELTQLYQALDTHPSCDPAGLMPPLPFQYTDFVHWQRQWLSDGGLQQQKAYWLQQLQGLPELLDLPTDFPRPQEKTYNGACEPVHFPLTLQQQLIDFSLRQGVTLYMTMLSAITIVLSRYSHQTDIALGSPVANRNHPGVENLMGFFVNTLVLRSNVSGNPRFVDFLSQVRQTALDAYSHQDIPFEYLVEALRPRRAPAYSPLFQVMFALQNIPVQQHDIADVSLRPIENPNTAAKFDITINLAETATGLRGNVEYNTDLFLPATITGLIAQLQNLLQAIVTQPELPIAHLDFLSQTEKQRTENAGPQTVAHTSACECSVVALFAAQVVCTPDKPAVHFAHQQISYRDLAIRSQRLADYLMDYDLGEGAAVGVIVTSAIEYAVALLGILKAGGVCVPIAPASPTHCIEYIVRDAEIGLMLTQGAWEFLASVGVQQIDLDKLVNEMPQDNAPRGHIRNSRHSGCWYSIAAAQRGGQAASLMYAWDIGKPRVRVFTHLNITAALNTPILTEFAQGPVAFISAWDPESWGGMQSPFWAGLLSGAGVCWVTEAVEHLKPRYLEDGVLYLSVVAFERLSRLDSELFSSFSHLILGGSGYNPAVVEEVAEAFPLCRISFCCTLPESLVPIAFYRQLPRRALGISHSDGRVYSVNYGASIPVGRLGGCFRVFILDALGSHAPAGAIGELCLAGPAISSDRYASSESCGSSDDCRDGDWQWPQSNLRPPACEHGEPLVYTGRLASWTPEGELALFGRIPTREENVQYELESVLLEQLPLLSVAFVQPDNDGQPLLYLQASNPVDDKDSFSKSVRRVLRSQPWLYILPADIIFLGDNAPRNHEGSLDRSRLPKVLPEPLDYIAPRTATEHLLASIWSELLPLAKEEISCDSNFFALGGHSLLLTRLLAKLREQGLYTDIRSVFNAPTLAALAAVLDQVGQKLAEFTAPPNLIPPRCEHITPQMLSLLDLSTREINAITATVSGGAANIQDIYPLAPLQEGIYFHHSLEGGKDPYVLQMLLSVASETQLNAFVNALQTVVERHDVLRTAIVMEGLSVPVQVVYRRAPLVTKAFQLSPGGDLQKEFINRVAQTPAMDMSQAPLLHLYTTRDPGGSRYLMSLNLHHIIIDHVGMEQVLQEIGALLTSDHARLPAPVPYRTFVALALHQRRTSAAQDFFSEQLSDVKHTCAPFGLVNVYSDGQRVDVANQPLSRDLSKALRGLARAQKISCATLFHAAWAMVVGVCANCEDVVFGTVVSGRLQSLQDGDRALGLFINTLPLRIVLFGKNVAQLLEDTDSALHQLLSYEQTPLSLAQGCSGLSGGKPLFSAILNYRHSSIEAAEDGDDITDFGITPLSLQERSNYPLNISVNDYGEDFSLDALVDSSVSAQKVLNYFVTAISRLVDAVNAHDDSPVTQFTLLPNEEKYQLLQQWSSAARWSHSYFSKRKTIEGRKVYVLDQHLRPTPVSVAGELYIDVKASADGECHSEDWLENPYTTDKDSHLYGTGDQVRWLETGELQWLGRSPRQRRRDCQSLTSLICHYAGVREAFVLDHGTVYAQPYAYVVPGEEGSAISPAGLRDYIRCQAPLYPLPVQIVVSDKLPLTEDGSSDPSAISPSDRHETGAVDYVAPETGEEKLLVELWAQLLPYEQEDIGIEADFFALGGQSLLATMLVNLIKQRTGIALPLRTVFERPTLRMLAHELATQPVNSHAMPITPVERNRHIPLSFAQQRMWFLAKLEGVNAHYNIPMALRLSGTLNQDVLIAALRKIIQRHEVLRTHFEEDAGRAFQCIDRCDDFVIEKQWIEREELVTLCEREASMPFDLSTGPLLRARLLILSAREHVLIMTVHHSVADGWSMTIFFQELVALYQAIKEKAAIPLAPQRVQYADYAHWQRQWLTEAVLQQQRDYWLQKLANLPVFSGLPTDYPHPEKKTYRGAHQPLNFSRQLMDRLNTLSLEYGVTLYMTLLAAFALLVSRYSHQTDVVIGTPVANRNHPGTEELIGLFVNTLVMRSDLSGNPLFSTLLKQVKETALDAYANQDIPFEHLVESFRSERSQRYSPLFQVAFALQNIPSHQHRLDDLEFSSVDFAVSIAKFDLTLNLHETATGLQGSMEYNTDLFTPATVTTLIARYEHLLTVIVDRPEEKIGALSCLSDADLDQIAEDWRHSLCTAATDVSLCELFEIRVAQSPQVPAFIYNKSVCNYGQLNARANQLAHYLLQHSLPGESIIGLCLRNWINLTVAKLGMLKANFAYVIIDPQDCSTRQRYIINDCNIALLLTETGIGIEGLAGDRHIVYFDSERDNRGADELLCGQPVTNLTRCKSALHFESLACVTYPCGPSPFKSGERPVGVAVQQKNIISAIVAGNVNEGDIIAVDVRVGLASIDLELWGALLRGASVTQWDRQQLLSVSSAETSWSDANVIFADIRSMLLGVARDSFLSNSVNRVYLTGESVHESELAKMVKTNSEIEFYYLRSPMECYRLTALSPAAANADKPLLSCALSCSGKLSACVLDRHANPLPEGMVGELCIGGGGCRYSSLTDRICLDNGLLRLPSFVAALKNYTDQV